MNLPRELNQINNNEVDMCNGCFEACLEIITKLNRQTAQQQKRNQHTIAFFGTQITIQKLI